MLPAGNVTFVFTDIEGSTTRWENYPEAMKPALERHDALLQAIIEGHGGHVFKTVGDAFCAAFGDAWDAVGAAIEIQRAVAGEDWASYGADFQPMRVRIGLHTGTAEARAGDYFGPTVNRTARLQAAGHGGQVLLSEATRLLVQDQLPAEFRLRDWGTHRLKDLRHAEHIVQLIVPDIEDIARPLRTAQALEPRDRIMVEDERSEPGGLSDLAVPVATRPINLWESLSATLAAVRDNGASVVLAPQQVRAMAERQPLDLTEYRLGRVAEWSQPRYRLDGRFVALTLLVDQGEEAVAGRWEASQQRYGDLGHLIEVLPDPALVVLGPPGSGKSTLLRQVELDTAIRGLRGEDPADRVTFFIQLNQFKPAGPEDHLPSPQRWLAERWSARFPDLPGLDALLREGRVTLLLDSLNEMPVESEADFRARVGMWKAWLQLLVAEAPGNRVVFACRSLDYSAPLSTPAMRVPQARIEPMSDDQVREFLKVYSPLFWRETWAALEGSPELDVVRSPYFLKLLVDQVETSGAVPSGQAALFTGFVRHALQREVERDHPLFASPTLLDPRDLRRVTRWQWRSPWDLPERGALVPGLVALAYGMQVGSGGGRSHARVGIETAERLLGDAEAEPIIRAGEALALLDEDAATSDVMFVHQLMQEYFAARRLAGSPEPERVQVAWQRSEVHPGLDETIAGLSPADPLPALPTTGWEETTLLAAAMAEAADTFVRGLAAANLVLACRCAAQPEVQPRLSAGLLDQLRAALVERSREPEADLRARIAAGSALGALGDPRFERRSGPHGPYLLPPSVAIAGGTYPIGPEPGAPDPTPHQVRLGPFEIGRFAVTNAEFACFVAAGGYEDERWWDTPTARRWRQGELTEEGRRAAWRYWRDLFRADPALIDGMREDGRLTIVQADEWRELIALDEATFQARLGEQLAGGRRAAPRYWREEPYNKPAQPVVGVSWFEARAYCTWLTAQSGIPFRLPSEAEWEAASRGAQGRTYPFGATFDAQRCNVFATHVRRPTPVGIFADGETPEGVADLAGNTQDWTSSLDRPYPYAAADGREDPEPGDALRILRGGAFYGGPENVRATYRFRFNPLFRRLRSSGFRVCVGS